MNQTRNEQTGLMALNDNWIGESFDAPPRQVGSVTMNCAYDYYPWLQTTHWCSCSTEKIKLTLSEVEELRKVAKRSAKVRKALKKFTKLIEVEVDFPA